MYNVNIKPYLVVNSRAGVRIVKTQPKLDWDEISIQLHLELPKELFKKPSLTASIVIPTDSVKPAVIGTEVIENIEETIKNHTGVDVRLTVVENES